MLNDFLFAVFLIIVLALSVLGLIGAIINIPKGISRSIRDEN